MERAVIAMLHFRPHRSSHGVMVMAFLNSGTQVYMNMESGRSDDCLYETTFFYGHLNAFLYLRSSA